MKSILVANWKMNPSVFKEAKKLFDATKRAADSAKNVSIIVAPPSLYLRELSGAYKGKRLSFAMQNVSAEAGGSFTGELSLAQAKDAKASFVIIGHAERRKMGETDEEVEKKVAATIAAGMTPILCVGETVRGEDGGYFDVVRKQLVTGLSDVPSGRLGKVLIAYEPVWAIGAEKPMSPRDMHEMAIFIRKTIVEQFGQTGMNIQMLYGGSIDETSAADMLRDGDVAGLLVGRASTIPAKMTALVSALGVL
jgi:triosephosphate isomerase